MNVVSYSLIRRIQGENAKNEIFAILKQAVRSAQIECMLVKHFLIGICRVRENQYD